MNKLHQHVDNDIKNKHTKFHHNHTSQNQDMSDTRFDCFSKNLQELQILQSSLKGSLKDQKKKPKYPPRVAGDHI